VRPVTLTEVAAWPANDIADRAVDRGATAR